MHITLIHLSDLHFENNPEKQSRIKLLREDITRKTQFDKNIVTLFTGDLVQSGEQKQYNTLFELLLKPLREANHEIAIVPGNHDVQHDLADPEIAEQLLNDKKRSYLFSESSLVQTPYGDGSNRPLSNYMNFEDLFGPYVERNFFGYTKRVGNLSIVGMNSAWLSCKREEGDSERGKLRVEPHILQQYSESLPENTFRVLMLHHHHGWLEEDTRSDILDLATKNFDLVLFGHEHAADPTSMAKKEGEVTLVQSPPLYADWSRGTNGYSLIRCDIETKAIEITYRSYSENRKKFISGEDFVEGGVYYPTKRDEKHFEKSPSLSSLTQKFIEGDGPDYARWYRDNIRSKSKRNSDFIMPNIERVVLVDGEQTREPPSPLNRLFKKNSKDQFVISPADSGLSTSAFLTLTGIAEQVKNTGDIPVFFDAEESSIYEDSILRSMAQKCLVNYSTPEMKHLAAEGSVLLVVDGLNLSNHDLFNKFRKIMKKDFPKVRIIAFVRTEKIGQTISGDTKPSLSNVEDEVFELSEFDVEQIRKVISAHPNKPKDEDITNRLSNLTLESLYQINEPVFPSTVAVLVETLIRDHDFRPINKARLLNRYVECLLGRFELEDLREGYFSSDDKTKLLSYIARNILERKESGLSHKQWEEFLSEYAEKHLIELPPNLLQEFEEKGLLISEDGEITFRADDFFSYFIAHQMNADDTFAQNLISDDGLYRHSDEVILYAELEATDTTKVLNSLHEQVKFLKNKLYEQHKKRGIDLTCEWEAAAAEEFKDTEKRVELENAHNTKPNPEHADERANKKLIIIRRRRGIRKRKDVAETELRLLIAMRTYGRLIRNAQSILGKDKLRHIRMLYEGAEMWLGFMMSARYDIASSPFTVAGGISFINIGAVIDPVKSIANFKYNGPNCISRILAEVIRNPQLSRSLQTVLPDLSPMSALFAREALLGLPSEDNVNTYIKSLKAFSKDEVLLTASLRSLKREYLGSGRNIEIENHTLKIIHKAYKVTKEIGKITMGNLQKLEKQHLLRNFKNKTTDDERSIMPSSTRKSKKSKKKKR